MGRRTVELEVPQAGNYPSGRGTVHVGQVVDARDFQNKPSQPSTPSVDGDVNKISDEERSRMIGRQRNGYGKAEGDIATPGDTSVPELTRELVEEAMRRRGYSVAGADDAGLSVEVTINEFWAWATPGMWSMPFEARLYCTLVASSPTENKRLTIRGYGINQVQIASDANWALAYRRAFEDFLDKAQDELDAAGL